VRESVPMTPGTVRLGLGLGEVLDEVLEVVRGAEGGPEERSDDCKCIVNDSNDG